MSRTHYDTDQPRISIQRPFEEDPSDPYHTEREIGQAECWGEATFWMRLGYTVSVARWNGKIFREEQRFTAADL